MQNTFTITSIDLEKGHVTVVFSIDGKEQTMGDAPLNDAEALKAFLSEYGAKYEASLNAFVGAPEKVQKTTELGALIGEAFPVSV